jgi:hypothetical protein
MKPTRMFATVAVSLGLLAVGALLAPTQAHAQAAPKILTLNGTAYGSITTVGLACVYASSGASCSLLFVAGTTRCTLTLHSIVEGEAALAHYNDPASGQTSVACTGTMAPVVLGGRVLAVTMSEDAANMGAGNIIF